MKHKMAACLVAAQLMAAPATAATLAEGHHASPQRGGFVGARLRVPLGEVRAPARVGLAIAPMAKSRETGAVHLNPGAELGISATGRLEFAAGGRTLRFDQKRKAGVSTLGWVAIGVGTVVVVTTIAAAVVYADIVDCDDDEECN